jgi:rSAM/selenodomain-associated transferase 1
MGRTIRHLILMVKAPRMGAVKTRLAREVGPVRATQFYRTVTENLIRRLAPDPRWRLVLAVAPDSAFHAPFWPPRIPQIRQGQGDLGTRMERLLRAQKPGPAVLIGSDIPGVGAELIAAAFDRLRHNDAVFGPAEDGGFWLIGLRRFPRLSGLFAGVRWSSPATLSDTLFNLCGHKIGFTAQLSDVDDAPSYRQAGPLGALVTLAPRQGVGAG